MKWRHGGNFPPWWRVYKKFYSTFFVSIFLDYSKKLLIAFFVFFSQIILWNLGKFAAAVSPLLTDDQIEKVTAILNQCSSMLADQLNDAFEKKLGLNETKSPELYSILMRMMQDSGCDFTMTFRQLGYIDIKDLLDPALLEKQWALSKLGKHENFSDFVAQYQKRMEEEGKWYEIFTL